MSTWDASAQNIATNGFVTHMQGKADDAIARLTDSATKWTISALSAVANLSLSTLTTAAGTKPSLLSLSLPTYTPTVFTALVAPSLPTAPSLAGATAPMWDETFWSDLKTRLTAFTSDITGSDDIDSTIVKLTNDATKMQSALYAKEYERKTQTLRDLYSGAEAGTGAKGFTYPNSMTTALKMDAQQKFQFDMSQVSRELIVQIFEWAKSNYQFSIQQGINAHNSDTEFNVRYLDTIIKSYAATTNALVEKYRADISEIVALADVRVKEFTAQINLTLETNKTLEDIRIKEAGFDLEVAKTNAGILSKDIELKIEDFKARVDNFLRTAKTNLEDRDANVKNQIAASTAAAQAALALAAGASTITLNTVGA